MQKILYFGFGPSVQGAHLTPLWSHVESQLPRFPQAAGLPPSLRPVAPFTPHTHTCDTISLREDNIGTLDVFFIRYPSISLACLFKQAQAAPSEPYSWQSSPTLHTVLSSSRHPVMTVAWPFAT
jgi:hypothetical protein